MSTIFSSLLISCLTRKLVITKSSVSAAAKDIGKSYWPLLLWLLITLANSFLQTLKKIRPYLIWSFYVKVLESKLVELCLELKRNLFASIVSAADMLVCQFVKKSFKNCKLFHLYKILFFAVAQGHSSDYHHCLQTFYNAILNMIKKHCITNNIPVFAVLPAVTTVSTVSRTVLN